jgi:hypothetical protein
MYDTEHTWLFISASDCVSNKAHTATVRRIAARYALAPSNDGPPDIAGKDLVIEVETSATLADGVRRLRERPGRRYVAVTNREALREALQLVAESGIGVMDPRGEIVQEAGT